ncbi:uncharacterized protein LOC143017417 [Oratosquilla oratoria]|uniref:uncharacterized protein LOC143017417 n=1 Tax=Oratosquilla oratoria TaxID=337810 RepID=UPI003F761751
MRRERLSSLASSVAVVLALVLSCAESKNLFGVCDFEKSSPSCELHGSHNFVVQEGKPEHNHDAMESGYSGSRYLYLKRTNDHVYTETPTLTATQDSPVATFAYWINGAGAEDSYIKMGISRNRHHWRYYGHHHDHDHHHHDHDFEELWRNKRHDKKWLEMNVTLPVKAGESFKAVWKAYAKKDEWLVGHTFIGLDDIGVLEIDAGSGEPCPHPPGLPFAKPWVCSAPQRSIQSQLRQEMHDDGTVCKTECLPGFTVEGHPEVVCKNGEWHEPEGNVVFFCFDTEAPTFSVCPEDSNVTTPYGWATYPVTIGTHVSDNSGLWTVQLTVDGEIQESSNPTMDLKPGTHTISFVAKDSYDNENTCTYTIGVDLSDKTPPTVVSCPKSMTFETSKPIFVTYEEPQFSDDTGFIAKVESTLENGSLMSWGRHKVVVTAYDNSSNSVSCEFMVVITGVPCQRLDVPTNGALVCHESYAGGFCVAMCGPGQDFTVLPDLEVPSDYLCNTAGSWYPFEYGFNCTDPRGDTPVLSDTHYFDTLCNETTAQEQMKSNALEVYNLSGADITTGVDLTPEDFFVSCGPLEV